MPTKELTKPVTEDEIVELVKNIIAEQDYDSMVSDLEDQIIALSTSVHEIKEELELLWKEVE
jgi:prefoldin subunit 5